MAVVNGLCTLDCPDGCELRGEVEGDRLVSLDGGDRNPVTAGFLCSKVRRLPSVLRGPGRVLTPLRRTGPKGSGAFAPLSWDDAYDLVATRLAAVREEHGGEAILPLCYGGSNGWLSQDGADARLFSRLGASRLARTVCAAPTGAAAVGLYGKMPGVAFPDYVHARLIVVWGANLHATGIHLLPYLREARKAGAKLVVVDPRRTKLAALADLHLALRPGTDLPLALAVHRLLFEEGGADTDFLARHARGADRLRERAAIWTPERAAAEAGVPADDLRRFADWYRSIRPAVVRCGWGQERNRNGGGATAAILALPAVAGHFGVRGGGYTMSQTGAFSMDAAAAAGADPWTTRRINMNRVGRVLLEETDPPVQAVFVYNHNPVATLPNQEAVRRGFLRDDLFTVVFDPFLTDTTHYADVVLPAAFLVERGDMRAGYGTSYLHRAGPMVPPVGEAKANHEVFTELTRRLGLLREGDALTEEELADRILAAAKGGDRMRRELAETGMALPESGESPVSFVDVFPRTPDGKVDLCPADLDAEAPGGLYAYREDPATPETPLALISPATAERISSTFGHLHPEPAVVEVHPDDAAPRGIIDGGRVEIANTWGRVRCRVRVTDAVRPGTASLAKGYWAINTETGATANALAPDTLTDVAGGACFNDARVEIRPLGEDEPSA